MTSKVSYFVLVIKYFYSNAINSDKMADTLPCCREFRKWSFGRHWYRWHYIVMAFEQTGYNTEERRLLGYYALWLL
jgi:hypothetical protein